MKKNVLVILSATLVIILLTAICIGGANAAERAKIERVERVLERTAEQSGYESLGVIDAYAISQRNGKTYDGPAVRAELFKRAGLEVPENCWAFTVGTLDGIMLIQLVVYEGEQKKPIFDQKVEKTYLYGVL